MRIARTERKFVIVYRKNTSDRSYDFYAEQTLSDGEYIFSYGATHHQAKVNLRREYQQRYSGKPSWLISKEIQAYFAEQRKKYPDLFNGIIGD